MSYPTHPVRMRRTARTEIEIGTRQKSFAFGSRKAGQAQNPSLYPRQPTTQRDAADAQVAQLVEHATENRSVGGSTPSLGTIKLPSRPIGLSPHPQLCRSDRVTVCVAVPMPVTFSTQHFHQSSPRR